MALPIKSACAVLPMTDFSEGDNAPEPVEAPPAPKQGTLYLKLPTENSPLFGKIRAILAMFPGENTVVVYFADTKQRRGSRCALDDRMLQELERVLGQGNVVVK